MLVAITFMEAHAGKMTRHPGGCWWGPVRDHTIHFDTSTVQALVDRGVARYSKWQEGAGCTFPVEAELIERKETHVL